MLCSSRQVSCLIPAPVTTTIRLHALSKSNSLSNELKSGSTPRGSPLAMAGAAEGAAGRQGHEAARSSCFRFGMASRTCVCLRNAHCATRKCPSRIGFLTTTISENVPRGTWGHRRSTPDTHARTLHEASPNRHNVTRR